MIRYLLIGILLCLVAFLAAGCGTSFAEWSGNMSNENGRHVKPFNVNRDQNDNGEAVRPAGWHRQGPGLPCLGFAYPRHRSRATSKFQKCINIKGRYLGLAISSRR